MKIGLFFGSFNPIHIGHLIIAQSFLNNLNIDELWFVVSPHNPLKTQTNLIDANVRLKLVSSSIKSNSKFELCDIEFSLPTPSYTIDTLSALKKNYPEKTFELLIGSDSLDTFTKWKNHQEILRNYPIHIYPRKNNYSPPQELSHYNINIIKLAVLDISSTYIRELLNLGKSIQYLVPIEVYNHYN